MTDIVEEILKHHGSTVLEHYGVPGMRWGHRKGNSSLSEKQISRGLSESSLRRGHSPKDFEDARRDAKWLKQNFTRGHLSNLSPNAARDNKITRGIIKDATKNMKSDVKTINKKPEYSTFKAKRAIRKNKLNLHPSDPIAKAYNKEVSTVYMKHVQAAATKRTGLSPSGKWESEFVSGGKGGSGYWYIGLKSSDGARHGSISDPDLAMVVRPILDDDGYIVDFEDLMTSDAMAQSAIDYILTEHGSAVLEHHGVKGMRWGHRKQYETSGSGGKVGNPAVVYAGLYASIAVAYTIYHAKDSGKFKQFANRNTPLKTNTALSKKNMSVNTLQKTVVKPINPNYGQSGTKMNCRRCTFAYEMRRRGLDVKATKSSLAAGQTSKGLIKAINPKGSPMSDRHKEVKKGYEWGVNKIGDGAFSSKTGKEKSDIIFKDLNSYPNGARGELALGWKFGGGHSVAFEKVQGKAVIFDTQSGKTYENSQALANHFGSNIGAAASTRLDNANLNTKFLGRWVENVD